MARGAQRDGAKERFWRRAVRQQAASGLGVRAFCRERSLSEASFYAWRRTLAERDAEAAPQGRRGRSQAGRGGKRGTRSTGASRSNARGARRDDVKNPRDVKNGVDRPPDDGRSLFTPVTLLAGAASLTIIAPGGFEVHVPPGFDAEALARVVAVLRQAGPVSAAEIGP